LELKSSSNKERNIFQTILFISVILHLTIPFFLFIHKKKAISFIYEPTKTEIKYIHEVDIKKIKNRSRVTFNQSYQKNIIPSLPLNNTNDIKNLIDINLNAPKMIQEFDKLEIENNNINNIFNFKTNISKELKSIVDKLIVESVNGENKRELLIGGSTDFEQLSLDFSIRCKLLLNIDANGIIIYLEMIESTGDVNIDSSIIKIVQNWGFSSSERPLQNLIINIEIKK